MERPNSGGAGSRPWLIDGGRVAVAAVTRAELAVAADILDEASAWMAGHAGSPWPRPFPVAVLAETLARGETYVARAGAVAVGTFALHRTDPTFWPDRAEDPLNRARYLHKVAVRRGHPGLGRLLVDLAERIAREDGGAYLRLDCVATNERLRRYYEELGYEYRGEIVVPSLDRGMSLYEKELG